MKILLTSDEKKSDGVYILHNEKTGQAYVGSGKLGARYASHHYLLKNGKHFNSRLQAAFDADPNFEFVGIPIDEGRDVSLSIEQELITEYASPLLLNVVTDLGKQRPVINHTEESKEKMRQATAKNWQDPVWREKTITAANAGRANMSDEAKAAFAEQFGRRVREDCAAGLRATNKGQVRSEEYCERNSRNITALWEDPEYRARQQAGRIDAHLALRKQVIADGVVYESRKAAAEAHGVDPAAVSYRINSSNFNWAYLTS